MRLFAAFYTLDVSEIESPFSPMAAKKQKYFVLNRREFCGAPFILDQTHSNFSTLLYFVHVWDALARYIGVADGLVKFVQMSIA